MTVTASPDLLATIVAAMPAGVRQIRINRDELERAIAPQIDQTIAALARAVDAGLLARRVPRPLERALRPLVAGRAGQDAA